jgi:hypothetical protein
MVLGIGRPVACVEADTWRTKAAQETRDAIRGDGGVPLLRADYDRVQAMAAAIQAHPVASLLLGGLPGKPEQSLFWRDERWGIWKRARADYLPSLGLQPRLIIPDYKSAVSASPLAFARQAANLRYHQQAAFYLEGVRALGLDRHPAFVFVVQEKDPPYLVTVIELDDVALRAGEELNGRACEVWRDCTEAGVWPAYSDEVELVRLPPWAYPREDSYL